MNSVVWKIWKNNWEKLKGFWKDIDILPEIEKGFLGRISKATSEEISIEFIEGLSVETLAGLFEEIWYSDLGEVFKNIL